MKAMPDHDAATANAGNVAIRSLAPPNCIGITASFGHLLIEGCVLRAGGQSGRAALACLAEMVARDGPRALAEAEGDFVALMITEAVTYAFKSFTSQYQLYYRENDGEVANRLSRFYDPLTEHWNEDYFARHVLIVAGYQFLSRETPLRGICRVRPGELVRIGDDGGVRCEQLVRRDYRYRLDPVQRREDVAPALLALLRASIRDRLAAHPDSKICVEISGGLDSSFIACLLGERVPSRIRGVMFSQPNLPSHTISEGYAREVADRYGIDLAIVPPDELPQDIDTSPAYADEPSDFFWFGDWFSRAVAQHAEPGSMVFTGYGADQLFLRSPAFLPYLLERREFRHFAKALAPASRLLSRGKANIAWQCALSQLPDGLHQRLNRAFAGRRWNPWDVGDVNMQRMLGEPVGWLRCGRDIRDYTTERLAWEKELVGDGILCDDWGYFSAPRTVTQPHFAAKALMDASPFCDLPLLDHVYGHVSALLVHDFEGRYKELLRDCQQGIVPDSLRNRQNDTFVFNSFQLSYVNKARDYFHALLRTVPESWIDARGAVYALEQLSFGMTTSSTRSVLALMGYLGWRQAFIRHCREARRAGGSIPALLASRKNGGSMGPAAG
jgi:asparagine synthase (glutamine-hydrolysing)